MPTLMLDTSCDALVAAIAVDGVVRAERVDDSRRAQALLELVDDVLAEAQITLRELSRIAVGTGPGTFTGLRVGIATARGLATTLSVSLAGISSLAAIAAGVEGYPVWADIDARRGERFLQRFDGEESGELLIVSVDDVGEVVGTDAVLEGPPSARGLARVAAGAAFGDPILVVPEYGRDADAVPTADRVVRA
jgi:tRNA threonylcarbamoyl adenosine modification protein YeaZ